MVFSSFGIEIAESELREACDCTWLGTDALQAIDAARRLGFLQTSKQTLSVAELRELVEGGAYPIVFVNLIPIEGVREYHALVVTGFDKDSVEVLDPARGARLLPLEVFAAAWKMRHRLTIIIEK
jgi:ABC-type bacteriocin/lantibiotic exporter with double-glycine peptidase domain